MLALCGGSEYNKLTRSCGLEARNMCNLYAAARPAYKNKKEYEKG
jgi:hypothetical protein